MLFRNCFVIFISFWSFAALAVGPNPPPSSDNGPSSASRVSVSPSPRYQPYPSPRAVQDSSMQPRSQGESSSSRSQGQSSKMSIGALLWQSTDVGGTSGQRVPVLPLLAPPALSISELIRTASPRPLPSLAASPRPLSPLAQPSLSPQPDSTSSAVLERVSPQPLPPLAAPSASSNSGMASSTQQEQNEGDVDFSNPKLGGAKVTEELQKLRNALIDPKGHPVRLRLHSHYLSRVEKVFATLNQPLTISSIAVKLYEFKKDSRVETHYEKLLKFLKDISPKLTKLSFINCDVSLSTKVVETQYMRIKGESFLQNIIELKFIRATIGSTSFKRLGGIIGSLTKLERLTLDLKREQKERGQKEEVAPDTERRLSNAMNTIVHRNPKLKSLTLAGDFFDEKMMRYFIEAFLQLSSSENSANLQELDLLRTTLSPNMVVEILAILSQRPQSLKELKKLYIPDASSMGQFNELKTNIKRQRGDLHILYSHHSQGQSSSVHPMDILLAVTTAVRGAPEQQGASALSSATASPQPLPPLAAAPSVSSNSDSARSPQQEQNAVDLDFSNPELDGTTVTGKLEKLREAAQQGKPVILRLHPVHFFHISFYVDNLLNSSSIAIECHKFRRWDYDATSEKLFKFLADISPQLTKLSFIDCDISFDDVKKNYRNDKTRNTFLQNIIELTLLRTKIDTKSFRILARLIKYLTKLERLTLGLAKRHETDALSASINETNNTELPSAMTDIVNHVGIKTLILAGGFFDQTAMEYFIDKFVKLSLKKGANFKELNLLETELSQDMIVEILQTFDQHPEFFNTLEKLYIPDAPSMGQFNELKTSVAKKLRNLHISSRYPQGQGSSSRPQPLPPLAVDPIASSNVDIEAMEDIEEEQNEVDLDFLTPNLEGAVLEAKLQKLRDTLARLQGRSMKLRLHSDYLPRVAAVVIEEAGTSSSFSSISIALELHQFQMNAGNVKYDNELLLKLLSSLSPVLTKLYFIDCYISSEKIHNLYEKMKAESTLLKNIIELKFMETEMSLTAFAIVSPFFIKKLEKLQYLTFNLKKDEKTTEVTEELRVNLQNAMKSAVQQGLDIKNTVIFSGDFFDETMMEYLKAILEKRIGKNVNHFPQGLNTAEIELSQGQMHIRHSHHSNHSSS